MLNNTQHKVHQLLDQSVLGQFANLINGGVFVYLFSKYYPLTSLFSWYSCIVLIVIIRIYLTTRYKKKSKKLSLEEIKRFDRSYYLSTLFASIVWGATGVLFFYDNIPYQVFIAFTLAGMTAGASAIYVSDIKYSYTYILISIVPVSINLLLGNDPIQIAMGSMCLLYTIFMLMSSKKSHNKYKEALQLEIDLSKEKSEKEITEQTLQYKNNFLYQMSHEIRTPLNGLTGMIEMLLKTELNKKQEDMLDTANTSSKSLIKIVNNILDLSKLEQGEVQLNEEDFYLEKMLHHSIGLYQAKAENQGNILTLKLLETNYDYLYYFDQGRLIQVLNNLISNAIKFTNNGEIELGVKILNKGKEVDRILFYVKDTGTGISSDELELIFDQFHQIKSNTLKRADGTIMGTGLGLSICNNILALFGSELQIESILGKGTTFSFELEMKKGVCPNIPLAINLPEHKTLNILLVEDKLVNQTVAKLMLQELGCKVDIAKNGQEAIDKVSSVNSYDIIFMDIQMPVMDGIEATKVLKEQFPGINIIGLSANIQYTKEDMYQGIGFDGFLSKPLQFSQLQQVIAQNIK